MKVSLKTSLAALVVMLGCGSVGAPAAGPELSVSPDRAEPGDSITLTLTNDTAERVGYNLCPASLSRRAGSDWLVLQSDRICTMELRTLDPGGRDSFRIQLQTDLEPGQYRFETQLVELASDQQRSVASEPFRVD